MYFIGSPSGDNLMVAGDGRADMMCASRRVRSREADSDDSHAPLLFCRRSRRAMTTARWPLVVRRRDIERDPRPAGGNFGSMTLLPVPVPPIVSRGLGIFCVNTADRVLAITYDDGPHREHTPRILDELARHGATATFFVLSRQAEKYPEIVRRIIAEGHEVGLHGRDHRSLLTFKTADALAEIRSARAAVEAITGVPIVVYRPPYGEGTVLQGMAIPILGLDVVMWSGDALDWLHDNEQRIAARAVSGVSEGGILLLHDDRGDPETLALDEAAPAFDRALVTGLILDHLELNRYRTTTVSGLVGSYQQVRSTAKQRLSGR